MIGDGVEVRVLRVGRDGVRLGVTAPHSVAVHRLEVYEQIRQENQQAAGAIAAVGELASRVRRIASAAVGIGQDREPASRT